MSNMLKKILKFILISLGIFTGGILDLIILFIILSCLIFQDLKIKESDVRAQITAEKPDLERYKPILDYVEGYKAKYNKYPEELPQKYKNIVSDKFDGFDYELTKYGNYIFRIFPKHGPIEFYQPKSLYKWRADGDGMEDGFLDNEFYYKVNDDWQAIHFQYFTRYNKFLDKDSCLDGGGCWDYIRHRCETKDQGYCFRNEQECIKQDGKWQEYKRYCELN